MFIYLSIFILFESVYYRAEQLQQDMVRTLKDAGVVKSQLQSAIKENEVWIYFIFFSFLPLCLFTNIIYLFINYIYISLKLSFLSLFFNLFIYSFPFFFQDLQEQIRAQNSENEEMQREIRHTNSLLSSQYDNTQQYISSVSPLFSTLTRKAHTLRERLSRLDERRMREFTEFCAESEKNGRILDGLVSSLASNQNSAEAAQETVRKSGRELLVRLQDTTHTTVQHIAAVVASVQATLAAALTQHTELQQQQRREADAQKAQLAQQKELLAQWLAKEAQWQRAMDAAAAQQSAAERALREHTVRAENVQEQHAEEEQRWKGEKEKLVRTHAEEAVQFQQEIMQANQELKRVKELLSAANERIAEYEQTVASLREERDTEHDNVATNQAVAKSLRDENTKLRQEMNSNTNEKEQMEKKLEEETQRNSELETDLESLTGKYNEQCNVLFLVVSFRSFRVYWYLFILLYDFHRLLKIYSRT